MAVSGVGVYSIFDALYGQVGKPFTDGQKDRAHQKLDGLMGPAVVDRAMDNIAAATTDWNIEPREFGPALAVILNATVKPQTARYLRSKPAELR